MSTGKRKGRFLLAIFMMFFWSGMLCGISNAKEKILRISQSMEPATLYPSGRTGYNPIEKAVERDKFMSALEAKDFGLIDEVVNSRPKAA